MKDMVAVVTGGAGFIGSHLVDALVERREEVIVIDNLSTGSTANIDAHITSGKVRFVQADLLEDGWQDTLAGAGRVYHIAADPDVRASASNAQKVYDQNVTATIRVLEAMHKNHVNEIVFTSTSTVYGEAKTIPTPEEYSPLEPISIYGGSKLACEAMISAYAHTYGMKSWIFRFANIIGQRSNHGVIWDFIHKLRKNSNQLEILGDGKQVKSYLSVDACVDAVLFATAHSDATFNCFNIGSDDWISVTELAEIVVEEMGLSGVEFCYTGGDRGWVGDVPKMQLSIAKLQALGWRAGISSFESVQDATRAILHEIREREVV